MPGETVVTVEVPEVPDVEVLPVIEDPTTQVVETAIELAGVIDQARKDGEVKGEVVIYSLENLRDEVRELKGMIEYLADEIATLTAVQVAEIVVEEPPAVVEQIEQVAEALEPTPQVVEAVNEPAPRINKRVRKYID